jgi:glycosyltransferase involved in cell wall biosynthesis
MKLVLVHNFYGSSAPSGENQVFRAEKNLLLERGHSVEELSRKSDEIRKHKSWGALRGALSTPWNPWMARNIRILATEFQPSVVHVHNTFPLISPSIFSSVGKRSAKVLTLHNYRLFCPAAIPLREGKVCTQCLDSQSVIPSLRHGCYRNSRIATLPLAANVALHRWLGTWTIHVDAFIALSEFQRELMINAGLPKHKVHVKPNFFPGNPTPVKWSARKGDFVFVGRLSEEKGLLTLIEAWRQWGETAPQLRVIGEGPLRNDLQKRAAGLNILFLGQLPVEQTQSEIASARMLVLPSQCFEGFPMVIREAFAFGTPAAVSNLGPLPSIVQCGKSGLVFESANVNSLLEKLRTAWKSPDLLEQLGQGARLSFEANYNEDTNYQKLMEIYDRALFENQQVII